MCTLSGLLVLTFDPNNMQRQGMQQPGIQMSSYWPSVWGGGVIVAALSVYFTCMHLFERERERCVFVCVTEGDRKCAWKSMCSRTRRCGKWCRAVDVFLASQGAAGSMASMLFQVFLCVRQTRAARKNGPRYMI